jgi:carboxyl-terminal processing protease
MKYLLVTFGILLLKVAFACELDEVKSILDREYVKEISNSDIEKAAVKGVISSLDPHSNYIEKEDFKELNNIMNNSYVGIGVEIAISRGYPVILGISEGSPAEKALLKLGDIIVSANDKKLSGLPIAEVREIIKGKVGTTVNLKALRHDKEIDFKITRDKIKLIPVTVKLIYDIAYIKIRNFSKGIGDTIKKSYEVLDQDKIKGIIIDMRYNPGGLLDEAVNVSSLFLDRKAKIVSIKGRSEKVTGEFFSNGNDIAKGVPIVVIINGGSASASEIVAGALQDHKRAEVVGTKSFGKGSVQTTYTLKNGDVIKITTALYYTPLGRAIQGNGVDPDIVVEDEMVLEKVPSVGEFSENNLKNTLPNDLFDKNEILEKVQLYRSKIMGDIERDFQLMRALDVIRTMNFYKK